MLEKGFSNPTDRVVRLRNMILTAKPYVESERAVLATEAYKETEQLPAIMRRAKVVEKIFNQLPVTIRPDELIVGAVTINPRSTEICPEFSYDWVEKEFETMEHRIADPFVIPKKTAQELHEAFKYWPGKTTSALAASYMSEGTKESMASGVFTVGNYFFGGVGHVSVDYGKVLKIGFRGIINEVSRALESLDRTEPGYIKKEQFYNAVLISYNAAIRFAHRYAEEASRLAQQESNPTRKRELEQIAQNCILACRNTVLPHSGKHARHSGLFRACYRLNPAVILSPRGVSTSICTRIWSRTNLSRVNSRRNWWIAAGSSLTTLTKRVTKSLPRRLPVTQCSRTCAVAARQKTVATQLTI